MAKVTTDVEIAEALQKSVPVRIEPRTYLALAELVSKNRRSITAEINAILDTHITVQEAWPD